MEYISYLGLKKQFKASEILRIGQKNLEVLPFIDSLMETQLELIPTKAPRVTPNEVNTVMGALVNARWKTGRQILESLGMEVTGNNLRWVTACASASRGHILSYPGSPGYMLTFKATSEEVAGDQAILNQSNAMRERYIDIERVYHTKAVPAIPGKI